MHNIELLALAHTRALIEYTHTHTWRAYMALHGVLVLSQQQLPTTHQHTFHLAVSLQSILFTALL